MADNRGVGRWLMGAIALAFGCSDQAALRYEETAAWQQALAYPQLDGKCGRLYTFPNRDDTTVVTFLDAYTQRNAYVMTRPREENDTQRWCFTLQTNAGGAHSTGGFSPGGMGGFGFGGANGGTGAGASTDTWYTIQHRSFSGQYLDTVIVPSGTRASLHDRQPGDSQLWLIKDALTPLIQGSTGRYLEALEGPEYRVIALPASASEPARLWQMWPE